MATKRKSSRQPKQRGSTMYGALAGLLIGLIIAAIVAFYVTKAPMPFVDRATREPDSAQQPDPRQAPDPNLGLYGRDGAAGTPPSGPTATAPAPLPGVQPSTPPSQPKNQPDELGALIATLPPGGAQPAAPAAPAAPPARAPAPATGKYYLQAGAYRVLEDAEALKARILLLGLPVAVQRAEVNGMQVNRVRVGPFTRLDDMNRARSRLGENKIESAVVRQ
ncbi:SPOR domain-containing protein [Bordetella petrii]|uniref:SPOR domain-containing protein n=1 Tax=Bordetella petrii TaxID=94624 RepID=UPI0037315743